MPHGCDWLHPAKLFVAEVALQVSGYRNVPLAWALIAGVVATCRDLAPPAVRSPEGRPYAVASDRPPPPCKRANARAGEGLKRLHALGGPSGFRFRARSGI